MAAGNPSWDQFVSATLENYRGPLQENIYTQQAVIFTLKERGFVEEQEGSRSIVQSLMYGENDSVVSYSGYDPLPVKPQEGITSAEFYYKYLAVPISIAGTQEFENSGRHRIFSLLDAKVRQAEITLKKKMNLQFQADGSGNGGKDITGLAVAVEDGTTWATYGGIDGSDALNSWWRNQWFNFDTVYGATSKFGDAWGSSVKGMAALRKMDNLVRRVGNTRGADLILTTFDIIETYEGYVEGDKLRTMSTKLADAGFHSVEFKGIPMVADIDVPAEEVIFLNSDHLKLIVGKGRNFVHTPFVKPENQDAKISHILWAGNFVMSKRDCQGRITAVSV